MSVIALGSDHLIFMGGGGGLEDFLKKISRTMMLTKKNIQDGRTNKKNIQDNV